MVEEGDITPVTRKLVKTLLKIKNDKDGVVLLEALPWVAYPLSVSSESLVRYVDVVTLTVSHGTAGQERGSGEESRDVELHLGQYRQNVCEQMPI